MALLGPDVLAGRTVWALLVPEALAYARSPGCRRWWACCGGAALVLHAAFGSSRHLVVGPMSATAALSAAIVAPLAAGGPARYGADRRAGAGGRGSRSTG